MVVNVDVTSAVPAVVRVGVTPTIPAVVQVVVKATVRAVVRFGVYVGVVGVVGIVGVVNPPTIHSGGQRESVVDESPPNLAQAIDSSAPSDAASLEPPSSSLAPRFAVLPQLRPNDATAHLIAAAGFSVLSRNRDDDAIWFFVDPDDPAALETPQERRNLDDADDANDANDAADAADDDRDGRSDRRAEVSSDVWARHAWDSFQAEVLVVLAVDARGATDLEKEEGAVGGVGAARAIDATDDAAGDAQAGDGAGASPTGLVRRVSAVLYQTRPRDGGPPREIARWAGTIQVDGTGRFRRDPLWEDLRSTVDAVADRAVPGVVLTVRSPGGAVTIEGLPDAARRLPPEANAATDDGVQRFLVRGLRTYSITMQRSGYRSEVRTFYVERRPVELAVNLVPYPRHTVGLALRGLSWPAVEYAWYSPSQRWIARAGVTSFAVGLTPLRQAGPGGSGGSDGSDGDDGGRAGAVGTNAATGAATPRIISSYGLTEVEAGWHRILGDPDATVRWTIGAGATLRLVHGEVDLGVDPVMPAGVRIAVGRERGPLTRPPGRLQGVTQRLIVVHRLSTDLTVSPNDAFVTDSPWLRRLGSILWHLPVYHLGVRVVL